MLISDCKQINNGSYKTGRKRGTEKRSDAEKTAVQSRESRWNTTKTPALCSSPEDVNLKGGGPARLEVSVQIWLPAETGRDASAGLRTHSQLVNFNCFCANGTDNERKRREISRIKASQGWFGSFHKVGGVARDKGKRFVCLLRQRQEGGGGSGREASDSSTGGG